MTNDIDMSRHDETTEALPPPILEQRVEFHRLARSAPNHRWWRPILVGLLALAFYGVGFLLLIVVIGVGAGLSPRIESSLDVFLVNVDRFDLNDPVTFTIAMLSLILLIPGLFFATKIAGAKPWRMLFSVVGRLRWGWLARAGIVAISVYAVAYSASMLIAVARGESVTPTPDMPRTVVLLALTIALVPLQCAAEEFVFRGYLMQAIGTWLRLPAFAIVLPVPLFVIGHEYGPLGMTDVAVFAIAAGYLTWRTGGLEAALALHIVGNVGGFALAAVGMVDVNTTEIGWPDLLISVLVTLTFTALVLRRAHRLDVQRTWRPSGVASSGGSVDGQTAAS